MGKPFAVLVAAGVGSAATPAATDRLLPANGARHTLIGIDQRGHGQPVMLPLSHCDMPGARWNELRARQSKRPVA